jgi:voltage-gated potassium channel
MGRRLRRDLLALAAVLVAYYAAPVGELPSPVALVVSVIGLLVGLAVLVHLIIRQVRLLVDDTPDEPVVQLDALVLLVFVIVPLFSLGYFGLERADSSQFAELVTKTDSLYFTLSTLATVGFGDVHATGQLARVIVMIQMAFDLVFVAAILSVLSSRIRQRAAARCAPRMRPAPSAPRTRATAARRAARVRTPAASRPPSPCRGCRRGRRGTRRW